MKAIHILLVCKILLLYLRHFVFYQHLCRIFLVFLPVQWRQKFNYYFIATSFFKVSKLLKFFLGTQFTKAFFSFFNIIKVKSLKQTWNSVTKAFYFLHIFFFQYNFNSIFFNITKVKRKKNWNTIYQSFLSASFLFSISFQFKILSFPFFNIIKF